VLVLIEGWRTNKERGEKRGKTKEGKRKRLEVVALPEVVVTGGGGQLDSVKEGH